MKTKQQIFLKKINLKLLTFSFNLSLLFSFISFFLSVSFLSRSQSFHNNLLPLTKLENYIQYNEKRLTTSENIFENKEFTQEILNVLNEIFRVFSEIS